MGSGDLMQEVQEFVRDQGFKRPSGGQGTRWWAGDRGLEVEAGCSGSCQRAKAQEAVEGQVVQEVRVSGVQGVAKRL